MRDLENPESPSTMCDKKHFIPEPCSVFGVRCLVFVKLMPRKLPLLLSKLPQFAVLSQLRLLYFPSPHDMEFELQALLLFSTLFCSNDGLTKQSREMISTISPFICKIDHHNLTRNLNGKQMNSLVKYNFFHLL